MSFLLSHWHCILPAVGIIIATFLLRDKSGKNETADNNKLDSNSNS
ncbi:hypothetical protein [Anaerosporobacter sp.]